MKFTPDREQKEIVTAAREFARGEFDPDQCVRVDKKGEFPKKIHRKACNLGFIGIHFPESYSGQGMGLTDYLLVLEALCHQDSTMGSALALSTYTSECLMRFADDDLKARYLPGIAEGKLICGGGVDSMNEAIDRIPVARKTGDRWLLNGEQSGIINTGIADVYTILCRTAENDDQDAVSMVVVEKDSEGLSISENESALGLRTANLSGLKFEEVPISPENFIGNVGDGKRQAALFMHESRIQFAAMAIGIAQSAFDHALGYTKKREQFGSKLADFQILRHQLAEIAVNIRMARLVTYQAAVDFDDGKKDFSLSAAAKLAACRTAAAVCFQAIQLLGGYGYMSEYHVERFYRDAKMLELYGGTPDQLKDIVAGVAIGSVR